MTIAVGDKIPDVTLRQKGAEGIDALSTDDVFKGKKVVLLVCRARSHPRERRTICPVTCRTQTTLKPRQLIPSPVFPSTTPLS